jgi:hypothetical protein
MSESVTIVSQFTRLPGVDNVLYGLEGRLLASAPSNRPMEVAGEATAGAGAAVDCRSGGGF